MKNRIKNLLAKADAPSPASAASIPTTAAELRAHLGIKDVDHVFINGRTGQHFQLIGLEKGKALMQCMDCKSVTRVSIEALMKAKPMEDGEVEDYVLDEIPEDHPIKKLIREVRAAGCKVSVVREKEDHDRN